MKWHARHILSSPSDWLRITASGARPANDNGDPIGLWGWGGLMLMAIVLLPFEAIGALVKKLRS